MDTTKSQMDSKSSEGATAVEQNMEEAKNNVVSKVNEMATEGASGMSKVASGMIDESGKIPPQIQSNMETSAKTIESTLSTMAKNIEKSFNDLCYNAEHYLQRIITKAGAVGNAFLHVLLRFIALLVMLCVGLIQQVLISYLIGIEL